jgi:hypothetical protein
MEWVIEWRIKAKLLITLLQLDKLQQTMQDLKVVEIITLKADNQEDNSLMVIKKVGLYKKPHLF